MPENIEFDFRKVTLKPELYKTLDDLAGRQKNRRTAVKVFE